MGRGRRRGRGKVKKEVFPLFFFAEGQTDFNTKEKTSKYVLMKLDVRENV